MGQSLSSRLPLELGWVAIVSRLWGEFETWLWDSISFKLLLLLFPTLGKPRKGWNETLLPCPPPLLLGDKWGRQVCWLLLGHCPFRNLTARERQVCPNSLASPASQSTAPGSSGLHLRSYQCEFLKSQEHSVGLTHPCLLSVAWAHLLLWKGRQVGGRCLLMRQLCQRSPSQAFLGRYQRLGLSDWGSVLLVA